MDVGLCGKVYTFKPPIIIAASFTTWERSGEDHLHLDEAKNLTMTLIMRGVRIYTGGTSRSWNTQLHGTAHAIVLEHEGLHILQRLLREAVKRKKVTFLWTLSVPPLAPPPPPGLRTLRGVFFLKARTSDSRRLERKNA